ncbi:heterokaryon incompatibility protein-domain-containing protein [Boeremia exigua]|uniref:heterokaryon incompatibility protein-domain-containing protein n=1 Tax=Boeremia exigua TaxID=749465 RepID=UPI001E8E2970|nr:heterokaryon incompatibility protein-domain-containing protein [Boeremia exigua]KAH6625905.1 heterokaryon incompatibility protein-domain-containing protein [Boeremia exigua]
MACRHTDVREFDGLRSCLACGETRFREDALQDPVAAADQEYIYTDLRCLELGQTIRIVLLSPGNFEDPVHCTIVLSAIYHSSYEAVSYTWANEDGDNAKTHAVYIDGSALYVTRNCHSALRQLRHPELHRRLWVDAMCINQLNVRERNHQVGVMDRIYKAARQVHACICDDDHSYSEAMMWIAGGIRRRFSSVERRQLLELFHRRYFSRVWVVQEIVLAKTIILNVNADQVMLTHDVLDFLRPKLEIPASLRTRLNPTAFKHLREQLITSIKYSCSDPRDHVYAILSLLDPEVRALIPVDYSLSMEQMYANVINAYIVTSQKLEILAYAAKTVAEENVSVTNTFTIDKFHDFLTHVEHVDPTEYRNHPPGWAETIHCSVQADTQLPASCIWTLPSPMHEKQILPDFRLRSYCIQACEWCIQHLDALYTDLAQGSSMPGIPLRALRDGTYEPTADKLARDQMRRTRSILQRLLRRKTHGSMIFGTADGVGVCVVAAVPGDRVCYLDGMKEQLLLRHVTGSRYRIVSVCLWEPNSLTFPTPERAEIIEVY